jgi:hypothetical protein
MYNEDPLGPEENRERLLRMPLYKKAKEIVALTQSIIATIPNDDVLFNANSTQMQESTYTIPGKNIRG